MQTKKVYKLFIVAIIVLVLGGCWDKKEVEERAYVIGLGIDKAEDEHKIKITYLIANPEVGTLQNGGAANEPPSEIITITANDFITSRNTANSVIARELTYDLLRIIVVSEEMAKDKDFIRRIYDATKDREIRRDVHLAVTKEDAAKYFTNLKPKLETRPHKFFQFSLRRGIETGMIPDSDLQRFFKVIEQDADLYLATYSTTEQEENPEIRNEDEYLAGELKVEGVTSNTQFMGSAIFKEGIMVGKLNGQETRMANLLDDTTNITDVLTTYPDPNNENYRIASRVIKTGTNKYTMNLKKNSRSKITIEIPFLIEVLSDPSMTDYSKDERKRDKLKKHLKKILEKNFTNFVKKTQEEFGASPFSLSLHSRRYFSTLDQYTSFDWMKSYPEMDIEVKVNIKFGEFGKQTKVPDLKLMRD